MPIITVEGPAIKDMVKKRELVKGITDAATNVYGLPRETVIVVIKENSMENVSIGGQLLSDRSK